MQYDTGKHCVFYHRYHIVWSTKYRYKVLTGATRHGAMLLRAPAKWPGFTPPNGRFLLRR